MTTTGLYDLVTSESDDGTMHPAEQLWTPGEDAVENGFIVHRGMHVTGIDDPTDDHLYPVGFVALGHHRWADIIEAAAAYMARVHGWRNLSSARRTISSSRRWSTSRSRRPRTDRPSHCR